MEKTLIPTNMKLPDLPRKNKRIEADLDSKVAMKLCRVHPQRNWALEVKYDKNKLEKHQSVALKQVSRGTHPPQKIVDMGRQNKYDYYYLGDADAIVCTIQKNKRDVVCSVNDAYTFNMRI
jgi:hypothetical protein